MPLNNPPIQEPIANNAGMAPRVWVLFFTQIKRLLDNSMPWQLPSYAVSTVPSAADFEGCIIYVSNESGGKTIAFSDGTNWRRAQDRAIIS